jgi:hypothetical protein
MAARISCFKEQAFQEVECRIKQLKQVIRINEACRKSQLNISEGDA